MIHNKSQKTSTKVKRSIRAISPVIATLMMIAIAVAASLVAYAWVMGYMGFTTTKVDKAIAIQSITHEKVYVQNVGTSPITLSKVYVNGEIVPVSWDVTDGKLNPSQTATITFDTELSEDLQQATIKITATDGTIAEYTKTFSGATGGGPLPTGTTTYTIDITVNPSPAAGSVTALPAGPYTSGDIVTLTPNPTAGYTFTSWGGDASGTENPKTITVTSNMEITATFTLNPPTVTRVQGDTELFTLSGTGTGTFTFNSPPAAGNLLVVVTGHRQSDPDTYNTPLLSGSGWNREFIVYNNPSSTSDRRIEALFWKIAGASEPSSVTVSWNDPTSGAFSGTNNGFAITMEYSGANNYQAVAKGGNPSSTSAVTSLAVPSSALSTTDQNILAIGSMVWRRDAPFTTNPSFSGFNAANVKSDYTTGLAFASVWDYKQGSATILQTTVTWAPANMASGQLVLFKCS